VFPTQSFEMPLILPKVLFRIYNDKLRFLNDALGIKSGQLINQVVQGFSQGLYDLPNEPTSSWGSWVIERGSGGSNRHVKLFPFDIDDSLLVLQGNFIGYHFAEVVDFRLEIVQVFSCPVNLLISAIEWIHNRTIQRNGHVV